MTGAKHTFVPGSNQPLERVEFDNRVGRDLIFSVRQVGQTLQVVVKPSD